jgi:hypothetical protein
MSIVDFVPLSGARPSLEEPTAPSRAAEFQTGARNSYM